MVLKQLVVFADSDVSLRLETVADQFLMVLKQLVVFADSDVSLRLETVADQAAISSNTVSPAPLRIRRSTLYSLKTRSIFGIRNLA